MIQSWQFLIPYTELWTLLVSFSPSIVIGLEDPTRGMTQEFFIPKRELAINSLIAKGIIEEQGFKGTIKIKDQNIHKALEVIAHPEHSVLVGLDLNNSQQKVKTFHYDKKNVIISIEEKDSQVLLSSWRAKQVDEYLKAPFTKKVYVMPEDMIYPIEISEVFINKIKKMMEAKDKKNALNVLRDIGIQESTATDILLGLCTPEIRMGIAFFSNRSEIGRPVRSLGVLAHEKFLWTIEASNQKPDNVILRQVSKGKLFERLSLTLPA